MGQGGACAIQRADLTLAMHSLFTAALTGVVVEMATPQARMLISVVRRDAIVFRGRGQRAYLVSRSTMWTLPTC